MSDGPSSQRLAALDLFRGATVAAMLFVNNPGDWGHLFRPFDHAAWHGWTPTDLIFPFFLFIVGTSGVLSLEKRRAGGATERELARGSSRASASSTPSGRSSSSSAAGAASSRSFSSSRSSSASTRSSSRGSAST